MITAAEAIHQADALLLDFDGPMARLMPPPLNAQAAERVRQAAGVDLPPHLMTTTDHLAIVRHLVDQPEALERAEAAATAAEVECAQTCEPAPWLSRLLSNASEHRVPWLVATNNSAEAVKAFLDRFNYPPPSSVAGRTVDDVPRMKPDPHFVLAALNQAGVAPAHAVFVGDSVSDVLAGLAAGVPVVGYAASAVRATALTNSGAIGVIMAEPSEKTRSPWRK